MLIPNYIYNLSTFASCKLKIALSPYILYPKVLANAVLSMMHIADILAWKTPIVSVPNSSRQGRTHTHSTGAVASMYVCMYLAQETLETPEAL